MLTVSFYFLFVFLYLSSCFFFSSPNRFPASSSHLAHSAVETKAVGRNILPATPQTTQNAASLNVSTPQIQTSISSDSPSVHEISEFSSSSSSSSGPSHGQHENESNISSPSHDASSAPHEAYENEQHHQQQQQMAAAAAGTPYSWLVNDNLASAQGFDPAMALGGYGHPYEQGGQFGVGDFSSMYQQYDGSAQFPMPGFAPQQPQQQQRGAANKGGRGGQSNFGQQNQPRGGQQMPQQPYNAHYRTHNAAANALTPATSQKYQPGLLTQSASQPQPVSQTTQQTAAAQSAASQPRQQAQQPVGATSKPSGQHSPPQQPQSSRGPPMQQTQSAPQQQYSDVYSQRQAPSNYMQKPMNPLYGSVASPTNYAQQQNKQQAPHSPQSYKANLGYGGQNIKNTYGNKQQQQQQAASPYAPTAYAPAMPPGSYPPYSPLAAYPASYYMTPAGYPFQPAYNMASVPAGGPPGFGSRGYGNVATSAFGAAGYHHPAGYANTPPVFDAYDQSVLQSQQSEYSAKHYAQQHNGQQAQSGSDQGHEAAQSTQSAQQNEASSWQQQQQASAASSAPKRAVGPESDPAAQRLGPLQYQNASSYQAPSQQQFDYMRHQQQQQQSHQPQTQYGSWQPSM